MNPTYDIGVLALLILATLPALFTWLTERRLRRLAGERKRIALTVTKLEKFMLDGTICEGSICHDLLFKVMQAAQYHERYPVPWNIFRGTSAEFEKTRTRAIALEQEMQHSKAPIKQIVQEFSRGYFRAFQYQHPWFSRLHSCCMYFQLVLAHGLGMALRAVLKVSKWKEIAGRGKEFRARIRRKTIAGSGSMLIADHANGNGFCSV